MEGHAGPVGGEMRPPGTHPSCGTVSQCLLALRSARGWGMAGSKAEAAATEGPQCYHGTCGHSHGHSCVHPVDVC